LFGLGREVRSTQGFLKKERKKQETLVLSCKVLLIERYTPAPTYNEPTSDEDVERRNPRRRRREK
jgi:hypothetical protein